MNRKKFIKICSYSIFSTPLAVSVLHSCKTIYYANFNVEADRYAIPVSEFFSEVENEKTKRDFVLIKPDNIDFPICLYQSEDNEYHASLLMCTHRGCELNVGGGIYSCPCHGSEFSSDGKVLAGPANKDLQTFRTEVYHEYIYVYL